jgi:hypothetical protein
MSAVFLVAMMMAQAPAEVPLAPAQPVKVKKQKPKRICETIDVTGSRVPQRICRDANEPAPVDGDLTDATFGISKANALGTSNAYQPK